MSQPIVLTGHEEQSVFRALAPLLQAVALNRTQPDYALEQVLDAVIDTINKARAKNAVRRSLAEDLRRLTESNTPYDDQARDLLGSYDIRPKP